MRIFYLLCFFNLFLALLPTAWSELYKCGDIWSTTPCADGSQPVTDLPAVRPGKTPGKGSLPEFEASISPSDLCKQNGKEPLLVERVAVNDEGVGFALDFSVRNVTRRNFSGPVYVSIEDVEQKIRFVGLLTRYLPYGSSDLFSVPLTGFAPKWFYGSSLEAKLLYSEDAKCAVKTILLPDPKLRTRRKLDKSAPLTGGEANLVVNSLDEEHQLIYMALPNKGAKLDSYEIKLLLLKTEAVLGRQVKLCSRINQSQILYRCGVVREKLQSTIELLRSILGSRSD